MVPYSKIRALHIEASSFCNAACPVCPRNYHGGATFPWFEKKHFTLDEHKKFFPAEFARRQEMVLYCGNYGDPSLNPDLVEICQWWLGHNPNVAIQVNTNAGTRDAAFWAALGKVFKGTLGNVTFSVDGLEDTNHLYRRNVRWDKVRVAMDAFIGAGGKAVWEFLVFQHNQHQVEEARALARQWGFSEFHPKKAMGFAGAGEARAIAVLDAQGKFEHHLYPADDDAYRNQAFLKEKKTIDAVVPSPSFQDVYDAGPADMKTFHLDAAMEKRFDGCGIDCMTKRDRQIYISSEGLVYPCCFIGSRQYAPNRWNFVNKQLQLFLDRVGKERYSLHHHSLEEILADDWFINEFSDTWAISSVRAGKLAVCAEFCGQGVTEMKEATSHRVKGNA